MGSGFDRALEYQKLRQLFLSTGDYWRTQQICLESLRDKTSNCVIKAFQRVFSRSEGRVPANGQRQRIYCAANAQISERKRHSFSSNSQFEYQSGRRRALQCWKSECGAILLIKIHGDVLQDIVRVYNHTRRSSTRMQLVIVTRENARAARENIVRRWNNDMNKKYGWKAKYHGDLVRISRAKGIFEKRYEAKWSEEIFRVHFEFIVFSNDENFVYLSDLASEVIDGIFYE